MDAIPKRGSDEPYSLPNWFVRNGDYQFTCWCGRITVVSFDNVDITGYVKGGVACNGCAKHRFLVLVRPQNKENPDGEE